MFLAKETYGSAKILYATRHDSFKVSNYRASLRCCTSSCASLCSCCHFFFRRAYLYFVFLYIFVYYFVHYFFYIYFCIYSRVRPGTYISPPYYSIIIFVRRKQDLPKATNFSVTIRLTVNGFFLPFNSCDAWFFLVRS